MNTISQREKNSYRYEEEENDQDNKSNSYLGQIEQNNNQNYHTISYISNNLIQKQNQSKDSDIRVQKLLQKNRILKEEIVKVQLVLKYHKDTQVYHRSNILPQLRGQTVKQELKNAYKQISQYEYQIKKIKIADGQNDYIDQKRKLDQEFEERQDIIYRLKKKITNVKKQSKDYGKMLKDGGIKKSLQRTSMKLYAQIKILEQKIEVQKKLLMNSENSFQKRAAYIKTIEKSLIDGGVSKTTLMTIQNRILQKGQNKRQTLKHTQNMNNCEDQIIEDRTKDTFLEYIREINLLKKWKKDYHSKLQIAEQQKNKIFQMNSVQYLKLKEIEQQIKEIEINIQNKKSKFDLNKLKPLKNNSTPSNTTTIYENTTQFKTKNKRIVNLYQITQVGKSTRAGVKFNDRDALGKCTGKIVEVNFYENREQILGLQVTYSVGSNLIQGKLYIRKEGDRFQSEKKFTLNNDDYFKTVECALDSRDTIVGIIMVSEFGSVARAGNCTGTRKSLNLETNQYPCCLVGSISKLGLQMLGAEKKNKTNLRYN